MNRIALPLTALAATLALAACAEPVGDRNEDDIDSVATPVAVEATAAPAIMEIEAGNFAELDLGAKIVGPQGAEPSGSFAGEAGEITSYVACPTGMETCDAKTAPEGTVFTYVHQITPSSSASAFRTAKPAYGFNGVAGYDMDEARAALGDNSALEVSCEDGMLSWTVPERATWNGRKITVFWQGTKPPAGPAPSGYELVVEGQSAAGPGPAPESLTTATCG